MIGNQGAIHPYGSMPLEMEIALSRLPIASLAPVGTMTLTTYDTSSGGSGERPDR